MRPLLLWLALSAAAAAAPLRAQATNEVRASLAQRIDGEVRTTLPPGLGVASLRAPEWTVASSDLVTVDWLVPPRAGIIELRVTVVDSAGKRRVGWAQVELREPRSVLVAQQPLKAGEVIVDGDLQIEPRAMTGGLSLSPSLLLGAAVLRNVAAGEMVRPTDVVTPPPVLRGAEVTVMVRRAGLSVSARGVLERDVRPGERATVRLASRTVAGRMVDANTVLLEDSP